MRYIEEFVNKVFCKDNLELLKEIPSSFIDLIYIDPPFYSQKIRKSVKYKYSDVWSSFDEYLRFMRIVIKELHRILKETGSFYLHIDQNALHYLKVECDKVFGRNNFKNNVVWKRIYSTKTNSINYGNNLDHILFYTKSSDYVFNAETKKLTNKQINRDYKYVEEQTGRIFSHCKMYDNGRIKELVFKGKGLIKAQEGKSFKWTQETYDKRIKENPYIIYWTKNGTPRHKNYLDEHKGMPVDNLWNDITPLFSNDSEYLNYPTQKPEKLLERIIKTSSNKNDVILDCFCGSGTTLAVAKKLGRKFIGCDNNPEAISITKKRLEDPNLLKLVVYNKAEEKRLF